MSNPIAVRQKSSFTKWLAIALGIGGIGLILVCGLCLILVLIANPQPSNPAKSGEPSEPAESTNPTSAPPPSALTYEDIVNNARQMTELKRNDYYKSLIGKNVHGSGEVADVTNAGDVHVRVSSVISYDIVLTGIPKTTSAALNLKDKIEFDGTINNVMDLFGSGRPIITLKFISLKKR